MRFDEDSQLDTGQVSDRRRSRVPGGRIALGGGAGVIVLIISLLLGINPFEGGSDAGAFPGLDQVEGANRELASECRTGADANTNQDCRVVAIVNSVQQHWADEFTQAGDGGGRQYQPAQTVLFSQAVDTGCGTASSAVGPFYCPADATVYLDLSFYDDLRTRFGANGGPFAEAYVLAHEYGHHVQHLTGVMGRAQGGGTGPQSAGVRLELQADCYAGVWANQATTTPGPGGDPLVSRLTDADIADGLSAAAAVGDDRIQQQAQGRIDPESWTHGSAEQRQRWFTTGYTSGRMERCDTFGASRV
jgi:predicted metalloprotease